ncbi:MAG: hypothetical protein ACM3X7_11945 [Solirubrobacterales bacterium]
MVDIIKVNDELKSIANKIGEAAKLVEDASKMYEQTYESFIKMYKGKVEQDEELLKINFVKSLDTLKLFYDQAERYVIYCLDNLSAQDEEEAESYNLKVL